MLEALGSKKSTILVHFKHLNESWCLMAVSFFIKDSNIVKIQIRELFRPKRIHWAQNHVCEVLSVHQILSNGASRLFRKSKMCQILHRFNDEQSTSPFKNILETLGAEISKFLIHFKLFAAKLWFLTEDILKPKKAGNNSSSSKNKQKHCV